MKLTTNAGVTAPLPVMFEWCAPVCIAIQANAIARPHYKNSLTFEDGTCLLSGISSPVQLNYMLPISVFRRLSKSSVILLESGRKLIDEV
jgi:hypothetical protein